MAGNQELVEQNSRHSVYVQRYAGGLKNEFIPYLEQLRKDVAAWIATTEWSANRRNTLLRELSAIQTAIYNEYNTQLILDLDEFGISESEWQARSLGSIIPEDSILETVVPAPQQIITAADTIPLIMEDSQVTKLLDDFIRDWSISEVQRVNNVISTGFSTGQTTQEIVRAISGPHGIFDKQVRRNNETIVRTATNHMSTIARERTLEENKQFVTGYRIIATLDDRTCLAKGQKVLMANGEYLPIESIAIGDFVVSGAGVKRQVVDTPRSRSKQLLNVTLETGNIVTCTADHRWLTHNRGWVEAQHLNEGDEIVELSDLQNWQGKEA